MLTLFWHDTVGSDGLVRSFRAERDERVFLFAGAHRDFSHLPHNIESAALIAIGERGRTIVERVHLTAHRAVPRLIIDRDVLVIRVDHPSSWDDVMRRVIQVLEDLTKGKVKVVKE